MLNRTMSLGELIEALERKESDAPVMFDFVYFRPSGLHSYRGDYSQLALGYATDKEVAVGDLLQRLRDANGATFTGYKGGDYVMDERTPVWVANPEEAGRTAIVDVRDPVGVVRLVTRCLEV
jgi:hypothetical protein